MATMTPLIESLLAYEKLVGGGKVCRLGKIQTIIDPLAPWESLTYEVTPYPTAYMNIAWWHELSPDMVPGAVTLTLYQRGMEIQVSGVTELLTHGDNMWIELNTSNPVVVNVVNNTPLNQYVEMLDLFLIVDTKDNLLIIRDIVARHQGGK
jgi:hypothetical protein